MIKYSRILFLALGVVLTGIAAANAAPRKIVSLNMCADQLLIALADRSQIAALTQYARDPALSYYAGQAADYPISKGSIEEVLALRPDLIIAAPHRRKETLAALQKRGVRMVDIEHADSLDTIFVNIRTVASAIGHPERGEALIDKMLADLDGLARDKPGRGRVAAYYQRRGFLTGTGTLWDEIMTRAGLVNLAARLDRPSLSRLSLEEMVAARPDFLVMDSATRTVMDQGTEMMHHPALDRTIRPSHRLFLPQSLTICGGPSYPVAVATLYAQIRKADQAVMRSGGKSIR